MKSRGFTLIELLIALSIFAIIALISYRTLGGLFSTREQLNAETAKWRDAALLFARVENDLAAILDRPIRTADDRGNAPLCLNAYTAVGNDATLSFTRTGFTDIAMQQDASAAPQRIGYRFRDGNLEWMWYTSFDQAPRTKPQVFAALKNIRDAKWRALDRNNNWRSDWPVAPLTCASVEKNPLPGASQPPSFPAALELSLTLATGEVVTRVFALRSN